MSKEYSFQQVRPHINKLSKKKGSSHSYFSQAAMEKGLTVILSDLDIQFSKSSMGQGNQGQKKMQLPTPQVITKNIEELFGNTSELSKVEQINEPIITISRDFIINGSFMQRQTGFYVNPTLLQCVYHANFEKTIKDLLRILNKELKSILDSSMIAMVSRQKFRKALNIADFCIFFTNQNLVQTVNLLSVRSDLDPATKELVSKYNKENAELSTELLEGLQRDQLGDIERVFRISMKLMIDLHLKLFTRSDFTLKIVDRLNQSLFVLYCKIFFSQISDISKRESHENAKILLKIGGYFIGVGLQRNTASIYELGVLLLEALVGFSTEHLNNQNALPSHLFKSLPIVSHNEMINWICNNLLYALKYVKQGNNVVGRININRIPSFKLLALLFKHYKPHDHQITYLLQQLCLQTKTFQIQRVYVAQIAHQYAQFEGASDIIKKYAQLGSISYNIKGAKKEVKISPDDVRTELQDNQDSVHREVVGLCSKYTIQVIFHKQEVSYQYSDKALWNMILYQMEEGATELSKDAGMHLNKEGEVENDDE